MEMTNKEILETAMAKIDTLDSEEVLEAKSMLEGISGDEKADGLKEKCDKVLDVIDRRDECLTQILGLSNGILKNGTIVKIMKIACIVFGALIVLAALPVIISGVAMNAHTVILVGIFIAIFGFMGLIVGVLVSLMITNSILSLISEKKVLEKSAKQIYGELAELGYVDNVFNY